VKRAIALLGAAFLLTTIACDKTPTDPEEKPQDETFETFLANFASEYVYMDSIRYAARLDPHYAFEFLPRDTLPYDPEPWLDREKELTIAGNLFHGRFGAGG
jgi:hypothetical protein